MMSTEVEITLDMNVARRRGGRDKRATPPERKTIPIPRIARLMALAIKFQEMVDRKEVRDYADLARLGLVTRARLTQIMNLALLAPDIQEEILFTTHPGAHHTPERALRNITTEVPWPNQRGALGSLLE